MANPAQHTPCSSSYPIRFVNPILSGSQVAKVIGPRLMRRSDDVVASLAAVNGQRAIERENAKLRMMSWIPIVI
jgi:hypothetical protein